MSGSDKAKVRTYVKMYARVFGVNPLLLLAMAYQESRFVGLARGRDGEFGALQVTEAAMVDCRRYSQFHFEGLGDVERYIAYGAAYVGVVLPQYINGRGLAVNWVNLLTAYNAGSGRVGRPPKSTQNYIALVSKWAVLERIGLLE